jgi:DNA-binding NarL/FixJ family response regulator
VRLFAQVAAHLGAGLRLRLALEQAGAGENAAEAVLDGSARVHHAEGTALRPHAREVLREAVVRRERARTRNGRSEPESALALWEGLVAGRWSLVDHFERDGKRFVVAHRNDPDLGDPRGLTRRERQVAEYLGLGWSAKQIAYTLGISQAAVSNAVGRAAAKLGIAGRAELAAFFSPLGIRASLAEFELSGESLAAAGFPLLGAECADALSDAEREIALDLLRGATVEAIAERRSRSPLTVETQIRAIYRKLGVGSRVELAARLAGAGRS